ncbi:MAG: hypothetical protein HRU15_10080 [Planctomycetes bacterium]|nr:hypothetical protein [Planctomycetota bacterium]
MTEDKLLTLISALTLVALSAALVFGFVGLGKLQEPAQNFVENPFK